MCAECVEEAEMAERDEQEAAAAEARGGGRLDRDWEPRVNIELLAQAWSNLEHAVLGELAGWSDGDRPQDYRGYNSVDGWRQGAWRSLVWDTVEEGGASVDRCGTAMCMAGWIGQTDATNRALAAAGGTLSPGALAAAGNWVVDDATFVAWGEWERGRRGYGLTPDHLVAAEVHSEMFRARPDDPPEYVITQMVGGEEVSMITAEKRAQHVLGLTYSETQDLFTGDNSLMTLRSLVATLIFEEKARRARKAEVVRKAEQEAAAQMAAREAEVVATAVDAPNLDSDPGEWLEWARGRFSALEAIGLDAGEATEVIVTTVARIVSEGARVMISDAEAEARHAAEAARDDEEEVAAGLYAEDSDSEGDPQPPFEGTWGSVDPR